MEQERQMLGEREHALHRWQVVRVALVILFELCLEYADTKSTSWSSFLLVTCAGWSVSLVPFLFELQKMSVRWRLLVLGLGSAFAIAQLLAAVLVLGENPHALICVISFALCLASLVVQNHCAGLVKGRIRFPNAVFDKEPWEFHLIAAVLARFLTHHMQLEARFSVVLPFWLLWLFIESVQREILSSFRPVRGVFWGDLAIAGHFRLDACIIGVALALAQMRLH